MRFSKALASSPFRATKNRYRSASVDSGARDLRKRDGSVAPGLSSERLDGDSNDRSESQEVADALSHSDEDTRRAGGGAGGGGGIIGLVGELEGACRGSGSKACAVRGNFHTVSNTTRARICPIDGGPKALTTLKPLIKAPHPIKSRQPMVIRTVCCLDFMGLLLEEQVLPSLALLCVFIGAVNHHDAV
jgi:hypothetical protein